MPCTPRDDTGRTKREAPDSIEDLVDRSLFWREVIRFEEVGSTNDLAKELASQRAPEGTVVVAEYQTAGRGRLDRHWVAPPKSALLCSILFRPDLLPHQVHRLTMLCSMAAADAIQRVTELSVAIKWPNDLIVTTTRERCASQAWRKLAGILTETGMTGGDLDYVVVGIGINVNVPPTALSKLGPDATSVRTEIGRKVSRSRLLTALLEGVEHRYRKVQEGQNPQDEWSARLATLGQYIEVSTEQRRLAGIAEAVDENGALLLRTPDGSLHRLLTGDATLARR